jgi:hypothetical protein
MRPTSSGTSFGGSLRTAGTNRHGRDQILVVEDLLAAHQEERGELLVEMEDRAAHRAIALGHRPPADPGPDPLIP